MGIFLKHLCCYMHLRCVINMREDNSTKTSNTHWRAHADQPCGPGDMARDTGALRSALQWVLECGATRALQVGPGASVSPSQ